MVWATPSNSKSETRNKFIKFKGCVEASSEHTNVPLSSARTWTPFHNPLNFFFYFYLVKRKCLTPPPFLAFLRCIVCC